MRNLLLCLLVLLISCQKKEEKSVVTGAGSTATRVPTQAELDVYVEGFREKLLEAGLLTTELEGRLAQLEVVYFESFPTGVIGSCSIGVSGRVIRINQNFWASANIGASNRQQLMYHELGHCILQLGHNETTTSIGGSNVPASIMYPFHISAATYQNNLAYYMSQLFQSSTPEFSSSSSPPTPRPVVRAVKDTTASSKSTTRNRQTSRSLL